MTLDDLIEVLKNIDAVHPGTHMIEARDEKGRLSMHVGVGLRNGVIIIDSSEVDVKGGGEDEGLICRCGGNVHPAHKI